MKKSSRSVTPSEANAAGGRGPLACRYRRAAFCDGALLESRQHAPDLHCRPFPFPRRRNATLVKRAGDAVQGRDTCRLNSPDGWRQVGGVPECPLRSAPPTGGAGLRGVTARLSAAGHASNLASSCATEPACHATRNGLGSIPVGTDLPESTRLRVVVKKSHVREPPQQKCNRRVGQCRLAIDDVTGLADAGSSRGRSMARRLRRTRVACAGGGRARRCPALGHGTTFGETGEASVCRSRARSISSAVIRPAASNRSTIARVGGICRSPPAQCSIDRE
jgi:hypothetical protein